MAFLNRLGLRLAAQTSFRQVTRVSGRTTLIAPCRQATIAITRPFHYAVSRFAEKQGDVAEASGAEGSGVAAAEQDSLTAAMEASQQTQGRPQEDFPVDRSVHLAGLNYHTTRETIERFFSDFGKVEDVKILKTAEGLSRGTGFVKFDTPEAANRARDEMDQQEFDGRRISVNPPRRRETGPRRTARPPMEPSETLFIGNMNYTMTNEALNALFKDIRNVTNVRVAIDRQTGQPRGFAHADFIDVASAQAAKEELTGKVIAGRPLRVDFAPQSNREFKSRRPSRERSRDDGPSDALSGP